MKPLSLLIVAAVALTAVSCKNRKKEQLAPASNYGGNGFGPYGDGTGNGAGGAGAGAGGYDRFGSGSNIPLPSRQGGSSFQNASRGQFAPIYFAFDSFSINSAEMSKIRAVADYARSNGAELIVAGFTDAVGTEEYNRGLGDRRALSVRSALLGSGLSASNIQTVSFGEEMLADTANPNGGRNRRVEFGIVR